MISSLSGRENWLVLNHVVSETPRNVRFLKLICPLVVGSVNSPFWKADGRLNF